MNDFFATLDRALLRISIAVLSLLFLFVALSNPDWSPLGIIKWAWGMLVTIAFFGGIVIIAEWMLKRLFR